jgi:hypothetical protein
MLTSGALDLVLGLLFVFLVFSLVVSAVNEAITRILASRSRQLWTSLRHLLDGVTSGGDQRPPKNVVATAESPLSIRLYAHPIVKQLEIAARDSKSRLSNIPATDFSRGLIDVLVDGGEGETTVPDFITKLKALPDESPIKKPLLAVAAEAGTELDKLRDGIGQWFDARMSSLSAIYRKKTKWAMLIIGLTVAIALNVDALGAASQLYRDQALRTAVADQAVKVAGTDCELKTGSERETCIKEAVEGVDGSIKLPVGWQDGFPAHVEFLQILGWLITSVALAQGAPFWFDLLRKAGSLRR